ncbi:MULTISPECIES: hypothetical protein [unclassified Streptomyces]|uniref:hypothetical protein n=1 Tax=unclassified Streptomyces TaxID=2593676 RepID=UPI00093B1451|nr:hypothetical protein [Streptomyces sp. TSRI0281]OKI32115.1 hypothetical protein A6A29_21430 [Streptomyces sp. TSRI0281]
MTHTDDTAQADPRLSVGFVDCLVPKLAAGTYTLTAHQSLTKSGEAVDKGYLPTAQKPVTQKLEVRAPRFTVEPDWIHGTYPPPGSTGLYADVLPHVTINRDTLPWEREAFAADGATRLPWMALLVFGEAELLNDPHCLGRSDARTVRQLSDPLSRLPEDKDVTLPPLAHPEDIPAEDLEVVCGTVLTTRGVFDALAPTAGDLPYLTHVRVVDERHQRAVDDPDLIEPGSYAVVVGNRLPSAVGGRYAVHLVSLEGWTLPSAAPGTEHTAKDQPLRLISLWSSAFETLPDQVPGFASLTENFVDRQGPDGTGLLLRIPADRTSLEGTAQSDVADRLDQGYVPLPCRTEAGHATFGWYRGPLTPAPVAPPAGQARRRCAREALTHLEEYGVYDLSLAVAFTTGRGAALADHAFAAALLRVRAKALKTVTALDTTVFSATPEAPADAGNAAPSLVYKGRDGLVPGGAKARLDQWVKAGLGGQLTRTLVAPGAAAVERKDGLAGEPARVTPVAAAPRLPGAAGLTAERVRDDGALRERLRAALTVLTGTGDSSEPPEEDEDLAVVRDWLLRLRDLKGVPFAHLVSDGRMLPPESLRFFHVDAGWIGALLEGALSVGLAHDLNFALDDVLFGPGGLALPAQGRLTGVLIRSQLVPGWPALEVRPYPNKQATEGEQALSVIRRDKLADDVLLLLMPGVPQRVEIAEPQQGVHFGIDEPAGSTEKDPVTRGIIRLRDLSPGTLGQELPGQCFPDPPGLIPYLRTPAPGLPDRVFRTAYLADRLGNATAVRRALTPAEFAIQLINAAQRRTFRAAQRESTPGTGEHSHG